MNLVLLLLTALGNAGYQNPADLVVPAGPSVTLDGVIGENEWEGAASRPLGASGKLLFRHTSEGLAVGVRGGSDGFPHIAVSAGDSVWVLHSSAALGSIVYTREGDAWRQVKGPVWEVRDTSQSPSAREERAAYLDASGWVASTARMGPAGESEFLIKLERFGHGEHRLAVAFLAADLPVEPPRWPALTPDDVNRRELLTGPMPSEVNLDPTGWALVRVSNPIGGLADQTRIWCMAPK